MAASNSPLYFSSSSSSSSSPTLGPSHSATPPTLMNDYSPEKVAGCSFHLCFFLSLSFSFFPTEGVGFDPTHPSIHPPPIPIALPPPGLHPASTRPPIPMTSTSIGFSGRMPGGMLGRDAGEGCCSMRWKNQGVKWADGWVGGCQRRIDEWQLG